MTKAKKIGIGVVIIVGAIVILGISPYFYNTTIDEQLPAGSETLEMKEMVVLSGNFKGVGDGIHDASGEAKVLRLDFENRFLRFENFEATNGPDLYVYLAIDENASEFVNLGRLKANIGNQNYEIPASVDVTKYNKVLIWCKAFSVLFGSAELK